MADSDALGELRNQQRPARRLEKTYGKKKPAMAHSRAMHFDLFGGGDENKIVDEMEKLTVNDDRNSCVKPVQETAVHAKAPPPENEPQLPEHRDSCGIKPVQEPPVPAKAQPPENNPRPQEQKKDSCVKTAQETPVPANAQPPANHPRLRGRRKAITARRMATLTQDKIQALEPLLSLVKAKVQDFQEWGRSTGKKYICTKLGEGAFADVFKLKPKNDEEATRLDEQGGLVIKVIPFTIDKANENDDIGDLDSVMREIRILQTLDPLHGFARCRHVQVVSGRYPDCLLDAFHMFKATGRSDAINPDPSKNAAADQMYVVIEMDDAGTPLSRLRRPSAFQVYDVFWKTAMVLAYAEEKVEFEHRDLHNGNVCYKPIRKDGPSDVEQAVVEDMKAEPEVTLGLSNLHVTVIDYTLARAKVGNASEGALVVFDPIQYWEGNNAQGESEVEKRQFDTYRKVRDLAKAQEDRANALADLEGVEHEAVDKYARFLPKSNVLWLGCLLSDLLRRSAAGRGASLPGSSRAAKRLQLSMWRTLGDVESHINGGSPTLLPESAGDLLALALDSGWLSCADEAAFRDQLEEE